MRNRACASSACRRITTRGTISQMRRLASKRGGECLSRTYINCNSKLKWRCAKGHEWWAAPERVKYKTWCPKCATANRGKGNRGSIAEMRKLAAIHGGWCVSRTYTLQTTKLEWKCAFGHQWWATPQYIKRGRWCPECSATLRGKALRSTIAEMQELAKSRGGQCISLTYHGHETRLLWRCADGHEWWATPRNVKKGRWCRTCFDDNRRGTIEEMQLLAELEGGACLSSQYIAKDVPLHFKCGQGHEFRTTPATIKRGHWCRRCAALERASRRRGSI